MSLSDPSGASLVTATSRASKNKNDSTWLCREAHQLREGLIASLTWQKLVESILASIMHHRH